MPSKPLYQGQTAGSQSAISYRGLLQRHSCSAAPLPLSFLLLNLLFPCDEDGGSWVEWLLGEASGDDSCMASASCCLSVRRGLMERGVAAEGVVVVEELVDRFRLRRLGGGALSGVLVGHSVLPVTLPSDS